MRLAASLDELEVELTCIEGDHISHEILATGEFYESELLRYLRGRVHRGVFVDVGAHVGNHAVAFALAMPSIEVIAVESNPQAVEYLRTNAALSDKITVVHAAVHDRWKGVDIVPGPAHNAGMARVQEGCAVTAFALDDLTDGAPVTLLKVDVEGAELDVLLSGQDLLKQPALHHVVVEVAPQNEEGVGEVMRLYGFERVACFNSTPTYVYSR